MSHDPTEELRKARMFLINVEASEETKDQTRQRLEETYGKDNVWNTDEIWQDFSIEGFMAPFVVATRKADGVRGSLEFLHEPRYYYDFQPA